jgi:hypothetical protein
MLQAQIIVEKNEMYGNKYLYKHIVEFLVRKDISGATVIRANMGFGRDNLIREPDRLFSFDEPPMIITFVDEDAKVKEVLTEIKKMTTRGLIFTHSVDVW